MPIIKASVKDLRKSRKRRIANLLVRNRVKNSIKEMKKLIASGQRDNAIKKLPEVTSFIDKAAKKNIFHKNNAAHKKSALAHLLAK
ncbi:30S ribosomal protein S20 [Candidatus Peregrinibacteria bacterium]|nr:30S ribosomal protein S20 [Candidatus Peregrinibacteria bacterium]